MSRATSASGAFPGLRRATRIVSRSAERRADIDGLRAFAIALVVIYHVWVGRVSGGVDVFLMVSAYFLTSSFLRRADSVTAPYLGRFWLRRFARLIPAAAVTVLGVLLLAAAVFPTSSWNTIWSQSFASLFYAQNWQLSAESVDYYARTETFPSPLLHFWSLSVQGQVFLLWPVIIAGGLWVARRLGLNPRRVLLIVFAAVFAASLVRSIVYTAADQQLAYFDTWSRLWEFALGSLLAIIAPSLRIGARFGAILAWVGIAGVLLCGIVLDVESGFPGAAALWPTLSAAFLILAGQAETTSAPVRFLGSTWMVRLGTIAYSLYLVHWPVLVAYLVITDSASVSFVGGLVVVAVSLALAMALNRLVERRAEKASASSLRRSAGITLGWLLIVLVPLTGWQTADRIRSAMADPQANPGAAVLLPRNAANVIADADIVPGGTAVDTDWVDFDSRCTGDRVPRDGSLAATCLETLSADGGARTALIIGDSHAQQWSGTLLPIMQEEGWNVVALLKGGCFFAPGEAAQVDAECEDWEREAASYAEEFPADLVVLIGSRAVAESPDERLPLGIEERVDQIVASGSDVLLIRDNPRYETNMYRCVEDNGREAAECTRPRADVSAEINPAAELGSRDRVHAVDLLDFLCPEETCQAVIGNVAVYLDQSHLSASYAATLTPAMRDALASIPGIPIG